MECMALKIADQSRSRSVALLVIYSEFFDELQLVLSSVTCSGCELVVAGDLNVHVDVASDSSGAQLLDTLQHHDLRRHVTVPTHNGGHTLDVVITTEHSTPTALDVCDLCVSDHFLVMFSLPFVKPQLQFVKRTRRRWADFDIVKFEDELAATELMN